MKSQTWFTTNYLLINRVTKHKTKDWHSKALPLNTPLQENLEQKVIQCHTVSYKYKYYLSPHTLTIQFIWLLVSNIFFSQSQTDHRQIYTHRKACILPYQLTPGLKNGFEKSRIHTKDIVHKTFEKRIESISQEV